MNIDQSQLEALARIKRTEIHFISWLEARYREYSDNLAFAADEYKVRWLQGRMQEIKEILVTMAKADKV